MKNLILNLKKMATITCLLSASSMTFALDSSKEVLLRFKTERLNSEEKFQVVQDELKDLGLRDRVIFYNDVIHELGKYGVKQSDIDQLMLKALTDLENVPLKMFDADAPNWTESAAVNTYADRMMRWALQGYGMSESVADLTIQKILKMPWMGFYLPQSIGNMLNNDHITSARYRYTFHALAFMKLPRPDVDAHFTNTLLGDLKAQRNCYAGASCSSNKALYQDRLWAYQELIKSGRIQDDKSSSKSVQQDYKYLLVNAQLEAKIAEARNANEVIQYLNTMFKKPLVSLEVIHPLIDWMKTIKVEEADQVVLMIIENAKSFVPPKSMVNNQTTLTEAMASLMTLVEEQQLSENVQMAIYKLMNNLGGWYRTQSITQAFGGAGRRVLKTKLTALQKAIEFYVETADAQDTTRDTNQSFDDSELKYTNMGRVLRELENCDDHKSTYRSDACHYVTSRKAIYLKIANNTKLAQIIRDQAKALAEK